MRKIVLNRQLLGLEDLLFGVGIVTQTRAGQSVDITRINASNMPFDETQTLLEWAQSVNLENLGNIVDELQAIYDNLTVIGNVEDSLLGINTLEDNLLAIQSLYTNIAKLQNIDTNMSKLQNIDTNMSKLQNIDTNMSKLQAIYADLTKLESLYANLNILTSIYNNLTALNNINSQVIPNLTELLLVNDNAVQVAADKLTVAADKGIVAGYKSDVTSMKLAVESIYDAFDDRFLGTKTIDPTIDNDGNTLIDGAMYFNTSSNALKVYSLDNTTWYTIPQIYLSGLLDVKLTSITTGDILTWNGTKWVNTSLNKATIELNSNMMTKAQFNALAEERKVNRAGSGFDEWGKHSNELNWLTINEGMWTIPAPTTTTNTFLIGASSNPAFDIGTSKTRYPLANINGVKCNLSYINVANASRANILLPTAPTIYPHYTVLTAEQIASGVIKHADSSNSGLIVNGKFDTDTSGWTASGNTLSVEGSELKATINAPWQRSFQRIYSLPIGNKYVVEFEAYTLNQTSTEYNVVDITAGNVNFETITKRTYLTTTKTKYSFEVTTTHSELSVALSSEKIGNSIIIDNIAVYPADAISRSDLVFLESWHEDISEKNFVYPLGNVQYLGGNSDGLTGIANGSFTGFETYSLFGNWQTSSALIGKGYVWSSLTEAQKKSFISNPENNCYLDGDKVIQVRYRVRVVQGLGDSWNSVNAISGLSLNYSPSGEAYPKPKGKLVSIPRDIQNANTEGNTGYFTTPKNTFMVNTGDIGAFSAISKTNTLDTTISYEGKCYALPIALVHRKNQGMYHNVYNPNGSKKASDSNLWYNTAVSFTSISDCFDSAKLLTASGYIGTVSGRPDGLFYDQIHEGDILDLRNSSKKVEDYNRLISREFNKLVAGTNRGKEGEWKFLSSGTTSSFLKVSNVWVYGVVPSDIRNLPSKLNTERLVFIKDVAGSWHLGFRSYSDPTSLNVYFNDNPVTGTFNQNTEYLIFEKSTRTKSNTLLHCDIIGNPTNYPASWKQSGVFGTPLIVAEDGTSLLPNGTLDTFKLSRKANATPLLCLRSTNNGTTWSSFTPTFSTTTNEITLTNEPAANLVVVYYQTHTSMAVPAVNSEVLEIGDVESNNSSYRAAFASTLIGKIPTYGAGSGLRLGTKVGFIEKPQVSPTTGLLLTLASAAYSPSHEAILFDNPNTPAVKVFPYLTRLNGKAYLNLVFKEMKYNGTSGGDDSKFNIVDNVSTTTDNNAQTVLIGQKTVELPYFIGADE